MGERLIVYRRDRCGFCWRLERRLREAGVDYDRRDIWADPAAAAFVRSVNDGAETVPTVVLGDRVLVNPTVTDLLRDLGVEPAERPRNRFRWWSRSAGP